MEAQEAEALEKEFAELSYGKEVVTEMEAQEAEAQESDEAAPRFQAQAEATERATARATKPYVHAVLRIINKLFGGRVTVEFGEEACQEEYEAQKAAVG